MSANTQKAMELYREVAESARSQWGSDYLWQKWEHSDQMDAAEAFLKDEKPKKTDEQLVEMMAKGSLKRRTGLDLDEINSDHKSILLDDMRAALAVVRSSE